MSKNKILNENLIVAGGGTGGHIWAGVAIADEWKKNFPNAKVLFVGAKGGLEERLVPKAGYALELLSISPLKRVGLKRQIQTLIRIPISIVVSMRILIQFRPRAVIGVGGYASGPLVLTAKFLSLFLKLKTAILEQNAIPGFTNKVLGFFSDIVFTSFPNLDSYFPTSQVVYSGNPVRSQMRPLSTALRPPFTLFIFGGSQGAIGVNHLILEMLPYLNHFRHDFKLIFQTGPKDYERVKLEIERLGWAASAEVYPFIDNMLECYERASIIVCRAGSSTLSEIARVGRAAIFVPLPTAADNHQLKNAEAFVRENAGLLAEQNKVTGMELAETILKIKEDTSKILELEKNVKKLANENATLQIVELLKKITSIAQ